MGPRVSRHCVRQSQECDDGLPGVPVLSVAKILPRKGPIMAAKMNLHAMRSIRQAGQAGGCIEAIAAATKQGAFAISLWKDAASLKSYVHSGAHGRAAKAMADIARGHVSRHMDWDGPLPDWSQWGELLDGGRFTPTKHGQDVTVDEMHEGPRRKPRLPLRA